MASALAALGGVVATAGVLLLFTLRTPAADRSPRPRKPTGSAAPIVLACLAGLATLLVTRWPALAVGAGLLARLAPSLFRSGMTARAEADRAEALAVWCEMLRDGLAGAAGLHGCLVASAPVAPLPIRPQVQTLAGGLSHQPLPEALDAFATDLRHPTGDIVVAALQLAAATGAGNLARLLSTMADAARDDADLRIEIEAGRARLYTAVRIIAGTSILSVVLLLLGNRGLLAAYDSVAGQIVLAAISIAWLAGLAWLRDLARVEPPARFLGPT